MTATSPTAAKLRQAIESGVHRIGEIEIRVRPDAAGYLLCHHADAHLLESPGHGGLSVHHDPTAARDLSIYAEDGTYRFVKAQTNLCRGWVLVVATDDDLRIALDHFYPASTGVWLAWREGSLEVELLRDKLARQTGMYRFSRSISDAGAQELVKSVCGPAHQCARRILWQLDADTPLEDSEASRYHGIPTEVPEAAAIPLLCREACNHFVAECRKVSRAEFAAKEQAEAKAKAEAEAKAAAP
jgi:hypothetical protein